jgi:hypothetical protein
MEEEKTEFKCDRCQDTGLIEVCGDTGTDEWDVVGYENCPDCLPEDN